MSDRIKKVLAQIVTRFETGDIPKAIAHSVFPRHSVPSSKWSLINRTIMVLSGTYDARGFRQWEKVGWNVKKGEKAFFILAPRMRKEVDKKTEEETYSISGFLAAPVFGVEQTEGQKLDYQEIELPRLSYIERAVEWGISVKAVPCDFGFYGAYSPKKQEIMLASKDEAVFFHELAHAAHERVLGKLKRWQNWRQEVVAELSAAVLCEMAGKSAENLGGNYKYISNYAKEAELTPAKACLVVMSDVEKVLWMIVGEETLLRQSA